MVKRFFVDKIRPYNRHTNTRDVPFVLEREIASSVDPTDVSGRGGGGGGGNKQREPKREREIERET